MQLTRTAIALALVLAPAVAAADGELSMRGVYYKERATRVVQPMIDGRFDVGDRGTLDTHILVDAITSASVAAGATGEAFDEQRYELGGGYLHQLSRMRIGGQGRASYEPDYQSLFAGLRGELDLLDKNLVLGAAASYGHDWVDNSGNPAATDRVEGSMNTYLGSLSVSQILSPTTIAAITYDLSYLEGFLENPYRQVPVGGFFMEEQVPDTRLRHAVAIGARQFIERTDTTAIATHRVYADDWGIWALTPELRVIQAIGESIELGAGYRLHWQTKADFVRETYEDIAQPRTGDAKLTRFTSHTVTGRGSLVLGALGFGGTLADARVELVIEYVDQNNRFGNAKIANVALTVPFLY